MTPSPTLYTVREIADTLRIHSRTAYRLIQEGKIRGIKVGSQWRVPESSLLEYIESALQAPRSKEKDEKTGSKQLKLPI
ncbi:helix-turn-helix domain-containing protein [Desulfovibrio gilichinskyi]|uniref:DNA binding domain-containing protein, excisionase family n=1 Tax=Desulfovibrio gilichinskyi TaxID=1519643 RepID=A0A1X7E114_9BACT|nr:helix-turn-helix domain-containing protein [Desulfovibrio gilichinskyi]SMF25504.1 DNA binding domain-containing protein, excisionase family [Desulfovibrio gilichinskyi]